MNEKEREVLNSLCNGDMTFGEASDILGVPKEKIEEMLEDYSWVPSSGRLAELCEIEMETLTYIKEIFQPVIFRFSSAQVNFKFDQMQFMDFAIIPNTLYPIEYPKLCPENIILNQTEDNGVAYIR